MRKVTTKIPEAKKGSNYNTHWIYSPKERLVIDVVYLGDFVSTTNKYLITMVDHFLNMVWQK